MAVGLFSALFGPKKVVGPSSRLDRLHLVAADTFNFEIVGEAAYQSSLDDLCGGKCEEGHDLPVIAQLGFQDDNPYDPNAIVILIEGKVVGYIPRDLAPQFRRDILQINPREVPVTCNAKIVGGWYRNRSDEGHYGVKLSIAVPIRSQQ